MDHWSVTRALAENYAVENDTFMGLRTPDKVTLLWTYVYILRYINVIYYA